MTKGEMIYFLHSLDSECNVGRNVITNITIVNINDYKINVNFYKKDFYYEGKDYYFFNMFIDLLKNKVEVYIKDQKKISLLYKFKVNKNEIKEKFIKIIDIINNPDKYEHIFVAHDLGLL